MPPPLLKSLGLVLVLAAARPLGAQTLPPGGPYDGSRHPEWSQPAAYQSSTMGAQGASGEVLRTDYQTPLPATASPAAKEPVLLPPRRTPSGAPQPGPLAGLDSLVPVAGSLAAVLGLFLVVAWALRRAAPGESALLPGEVLEVLGRKPLGHRQQLLLLRCGRNLLLVSCTPDGAETLTEITDPVEVDRLAGLCRARQQGSATVAFRQVLGQFSTTSTEDRHG